MKNLKANPIKTILTISIGFVVIYLVTKWKWAISVAVIIGAIGILSTWLSEKVHFVWMKLAWLLSLVVPRILLGAFFYFFLFPISLLAKVFRKKDPLILKNRLDSTYKNSDREYDKASFEYPW